MPNVSHPARQLHAVQLTDHFIEYLRAAIRPDRLGEAWECADRCARTFDPSRRDKYGRAWKFRDFFWQRWRFRQIDIKRKIGGRQSRRPLTAKGHRLKDSRYKVSRPFTLKTYRCAAKPDMTAEHNDTIDFYKRRCASRMHALIVDCVSSGLTFKQTADAAGVHPSLVCQLVRKKMQYLTVQPVGLVRTA